MCLFCIYIRLTVFSFQNIIQQFPLVYNSHFLLVATNIKIFCKSFCIIRLIAVPLNEYTTLKIYCQRTMNKFLWTSVDYSLKSMRNVGSPKVCQKPVT